jgi:hypothetical protein
VLYSPRVEHRKGARQRPAHAEPFVAHEEKAAIPGERAAQRAAELVLPQRWHRRVLRIEEVVGVEGVVAVELEQAASKRVGARPGRDVDQRRRLAAELRRVHRLLYLELLDRVDRRIDDEVVEQLVGHLRAVEQIYVVPGSLAADVGKLAGLLQRVAASAARRNHHRVRELRQGEEVAPVERKLDDLAAIDDVADLCGVGLQQRRRGCDGDVLRNAFDGQHEVDVERAADIEHNALVRARREARRRRRDVPLAGSERRQVEAPFGVGLPLDDRPRFTVRRDNLRAGQRGARSVADDAGDLAGVGLCESARGRERRDDRDRGQEDGGHH